MDSIPYTAMTKEVTMHTDDGIEFEATLNGQLVGYYATRIEAEEALDAAAYRHLMRQQKVVA